MADNFMTRAAIASMCGAVLTVSILALAGWALGIPALTRFFSHSVSMNPLTAVALVLTSATVLLLGHTPGRLPAAVKACALLVIIVCVSRISVYFSGVGIEFDAMLFASSLEGNRIAPNTAFCLILINSAALLFSARKLTDRKFFAGQILLIIAAVMALLVIGGFLYGEIAFTRVAPRFIQMALVTAACILLLCFALLAACREKGIMEVIVSDTVGGLMARRLIPVAILTPLGLGYLRLLGQRKGYYDTEFGVALTSVSSMLIFFAFIWWSARRLYLIDIERRRNEEATYLLAAIVESTDDAVKSKTLDGIVTSWNRGAEKLYGYPREEAVGRHISFMIPPDARAEFSALLDKVKSGQRVEHYETVRVRKDGSRVDVAITISPVKNRDGAIVGASTIARDISQKKREEAEKERLISELQALNQELDAFSYSVSHDLRSPLRAISGFSAQLMKNLPGIEGESRELLDLVRQNAKRMGLLIDDLLAFSRLGRQPLRKSRVDMADLARQVFDEAAKAYPGRKIDFRLGPVPAAYCDPAMMRQVLANLISNALKYSSHEPESVIEFKGAEEPDASAYSISDNGVGFDMKYAGHLFGVFQRLHADDEFEGAGVGLALVKRIINRHGGTVRAEGRAGEGAAFYFRVPK